MRRIRLCSYLSQLVVKSAAAMMMLSVSTPVLANDGSKATNSGDSTVAADGNNGVDLRRQRSFRATVPAGDYSGIAWLGGDKYAVVSDKADKEGYYLFSIAIDSISGDIASAKVEGFVECSDTGGRDLEGIAWMPQRQMVVMCGEKDNAIRAYTKDGKSVAADIPRHVAHSHLPGNKGLESLSYNAVTRRLWTCNEASPATLVEYDDQFHILASYLYNIDKGQKDAAKAYAYAHGISEVCAMDDGTLVVMEREFYVPKQKIGASVRCKLYRFTPLLYSQAGSSISGSKTLMSQWKSRLTLFSRSLANYEGMCLGPRLKDGRRVLVLIADSQSGYKGVMKDWLRTVCIDE